MKFKDVAEAIEQHQSLIGKTINGAVIEELVPVPIEVEAEFWECYVEAKDAKEALVLLINRLGCFAPNSEFRVDAVCNKEKIRNTDHIVFHQNIETLNLA